MELAFVISSLDGGGAERVAAMLASCWASRGDTVTLITLGFGAMDRYALDARVRRAELGLMKPSLGIIAAIRNNWRRMRALRRAILASGAPLVVSFGEQTNVLVLLATLGTRVVRVVSERTDPTHHETGVAWSALRRLFYRFADALVVQSQAVAAWARGVTRSERVHVVPNAVRDMTRFAARSSRRPTIVAVGRLAPEKGADLLLKAFAAVAPTFPEWRLEYVGDGPERAALTALVRALDLADRVTFRGWVTEPGEALAEAEIYVLPSRYEGFPNALLEAMCCGLAVISTASAPAAEIVTDGSDGLLVPVASESALAAALTRLMSDEALRRRLGESALRICARYDVEAVAARWDAVFAAARRTRGFGSAEHARGRSIVFLTRALDTGGAERQLAALAIGLHRSGWQVSVVSFYRGGLFEQQLRDAGVNVRCLDKRGRWDVITFGPRLLSAIREARPDIVHGNLALPNVLVTLLRIAWPQARIVWWVAASRAALREDDWLVRVEAWLGTRLSRFADLIVCNSEAGRRHHVALGYPDEKTVTVPNGIDTDEFRPDAAAREAVRSEWKIGKHEKLVGLIARLDPIKDHASFLRAAAQVFAGRRDARFVCVGDGEPSYRRELASLAEACGIADRVIWAGERFDMARVYNALDLAVSASASEGLPNAIAEAMASGVPCVATDVGDTAALLGATGWLCPPHDSTALARAILLALSEARPGAESRQHICASYSVASMIDRSIAHFSALLPGASAKTAA